MNARAVLINPVVVRLAPDEMGTRHRVSFASSMSLDDQTFRLELVLRFDDGDAV